MSRLLVTSGLLGPLRLAVNGGLAIFGPCAGRLPNPKTKPPQAL